MKWEIGQNVEVQSRTWPGINKPGGCAKIIKVHTTADGNYIEGLDVKYLLGGGNEIKIDPAIVSPIETLERGGRKRRSRDFLMKKEEDVTAEEEKKEGSEKASKKVMNKRKADTAIAAEDVKENDSSKQSSATYSTPRKRRKLGKIPKKVTPIPKMVTTKKKIDFVSPMTEDILVSSRGRHQNEKKKKSVARGLVFDKIDEVDQPKRKATKVKSKMVQIPPSTSLVMNHQSQHQSQSKHECKQEKDRNRNYIYKKPVVSTSLVPPQNNKKVVLTTTITIKPESSTNHNNNNQSSQQQRKYETSKIVRTNKVSVGVRLKSTGISNPYGVAAAKMINPRYKPSASSFSRTKSAYDKNKNALSSRAVSAESNIANTNRKPLLDVYKREVEKAREFMNEMVGHTTRNDNNDGESAIAPSTPKENARFIRTNSRYDEFLSHVYKVWCKVDDDEVAVVRFKEIFLEITSNLFTDHELDGHVKSYCDEGKEVMLSDETLYRIN